MKTPRMCYVKTTMRCMVASLCKGVAAMSAMMVLQLGCHDASLP